MLGLVRWSPHFHTDWSCIHRWLLLLFMTYTMWLSSFSLIVFSTEHTGRIKQQSALLVTALAKTYQSQRQASLIHPHPEKEWSSDSNFCKLMGDWFSKCLFCLSLKYYSSTPWLILRKTCHSHLQSGCLSLLEMSSITDVSYVLLTTSVHALKSSGQAHSFTVYTSTRKGSQLKLDLFSSIGNII